MNDKLYDVALIIYDYVRDMTVLLLADYEKQNKMPTLDKY